jgi:FkbM family methyltransferase
LPRLGSSSEIKEGFLIMNRQKILPQMLLRSWPFPRGAGRIIDHFFSRLTFENEVETVRTTDGFAIKVFPNDLIGRHIYLTGEFDRSTVEVLVKLSKPDDVLLDIGANIGYVSGCFLQNVPRSKVIAVEPQPLIMDLLESNLKQFGDKRYKIFPVGISDADSFGWLEICDFNRGASKVVKDKNKHTVEIQLWSAKRLFASLQGEKIDIVKIDVEGHEETVLKASQEDLNRLRPRAIFFEDHAQSAAPDGPIGRIYRSIGYQVFGVKKRLTRLDFVSIHAAEDCIYNDYLAVPL